MLLGVIYIALVFTQMTGQNLGAPGLLFFRNVIMVNAAVLTLLAPSFFASAISEEKEEDTLGMMMMAGISPLGLLLGKSTSRLLQVILLLSLQYPFTLLATTMGGLMQEQVTSAYLSLVAYTVLLANVGLLASVYCHRSRDAAVMTVLWLIAYHALPGFAWGGAMYLIQTKGWTPTNSLHYVVLKALEFTSHSNVFRSLYDVTVTGYQFEWSIQIIGNICGGILCFLLAWFAFGFVAMEPVIDNASRGLVARRTGRFRLFGAGRTWNAALLWKDFHFIAGGWVGILIRCVIYAGLYGMCFAANHPGTWGRSPYSGWTMEWDRITWAFLFFSHPIFALDLAHCLSRFFHEEIKGQTLSSILMLPRAVPDITYEKMLGCLMGLIPGAIANGLGLFVFPGGHSVTNDLFNEPGFWWWIMNLLLFIHLSMLLSIFLRWGSMALAFGITAASMFITVILLASGSFRSNVQVEALLSFFAVLLGFACCGCHVLLMLRLPKLAEK